MKSVYILNDKEAYGLGVATNFRNAAEQLGIKVAGFEAWDPKASSYEALFRKIKRHGRRRRLPRRPDRRERRAGDQGQGRRARDERRRGQAVRSGRLHHAADDRRGGRPPQRACTCRVAGVPIDELKGEGAEFVDGVQAAGSAARRSTRTPLYGAQAAQVLLDAIAGRTARVRRDREAVRDQGLRTGILGTFTINENGDPSPRARSSASRSTRRRTSSRPRRRSLRSRRTSTRRED